MMKVAAEECDGVPAPFSTRKYLEERPGSESTQVYLQASASEKIEVSGGGFIAIGSTDEAVARVRTACRLLRLYQGLLAGV